MTPKFAAKSSKAIPVHVVEVDKLSAITKKLNAAAWVKANGFTAALGQVLILPDADGSPKAVLAGWGTYATRARGRLHMATVAGKGFWRPMPLINTNRNRAQLPS